MPCCKCKEHSWPDPQPVIYADEGGLDYCLFHAPAEHKGMSVKDFNKQVFARIDAFKAEPKTSGADETCELSGAIFPGIIAFKAYGKDSPLPGISFEKATFRSMPLFVWAAFSGEALFGWATFSGMTHFGRATFSGKADFRGATFSGKTNFENVTFSSDAEFSLATFSSDVEFSLATFSSQADFRGATFSGVARYMWATFSGNAHFDQAAFSGAASFLEATFGDKADFVFARFSGEADFVLARFSGEAGYIRATFSSKADFGKATFGGVANFREVKAEKNAMRLHSLTHTSLSHLSFTSMETECFSFKGCDWPDGGLWPETKKEPNYKACEELYRSLKQKAADEQDQPLVSKWHYREKLMGLKGLLSDTQALKLLDEIDGKEATPWRKARSAAHLLRLAPGLLLSLNFWYWAFSGYGEREIRAGAWLAFLAVLPFVLNAFPHPIEEFPFSEQVNNALAHFPLAKDIQGQGGWLRLGKGLSQLLIALQAALFAFALRNRFRR